MLSKILFKPKRALLLIVACLWFGPTSAQDALPAYTGVWHFHSSQGYKGYVALDGVGGCSYFMSSVALTLQATCVARELGDDELIIFGTNEGISSSAPTYGAQLDAGNQSLSQSQSSTTVTFHITQVTATTMSGKMISSGGQENVNFTR